MNICAVSNIPKQNFNFYFPNVITRVLGYGIPDMYKNKVVSKGEKVSFAIIGAVCERKAQDIFVEAVQKIANKDEAEFWLVGEMPQNEYSNCVLKMIEKCSNIKMTGVLSRREIYNLFPKIDVVVCPSREDPLPIVLTEAMMFHKVCIASNRTGTAEYIVDGKNGFVVEAENVEMLRDKMQWIINNKNQIKKIGDRAREIYDQFFSMESFGERIEREVLRTEREWKPKFWR